MINGIVARHFLYSHFPSTDDGLRSLSSSTLFRLGGFCLRPGLNCAWPWRDSTSTQLPTAPHDVILLIARLWAQRPPVCTGILCILNLDSPDPRAGVRNLQLVRWLMRGGGWGERSQSTAPRPPPPSLTFSLSLYSAHFPLHWQPTPPTTTGAIYRRWSANTSSGCCPTSSSGYKCQCEGERINLNTIKCDVKHIVIRKKTTIQNPFQIIIIVFGNHCNRLGWLLTDKSKESETRTERFMSFIFQT